MGKDDKKEPFLENLGRATMRGLRKCKKCGTLNGTRGFSCKNKACDFIFKESGSIKKPSTEPFKIITGNNAQIYSVRVRDRGPDFRAFVQLPNLPNEAKLLLGDGYNFDQTTLLDAGAKCYVESCSKMNGYIMNPSSVCSHLKSAAVCYKNAQPLQFGSSVLNSLPISTELKHELYNLATSTTGPLVQRVSKNLFVVKCIPDSAHPLGFLHLAFCQSKGKREGKPKFHCSCRSLKYHSSKDSLRKCIHLYACVLVFTYDDLLAREFSYYLDFIQNKGKRKILGLKSQLDDSLQAMESSEDEGDVMQETTIQEVVSNSDELDQRSFLILNDTSSGTPCQVEVEVVKNVDILKLPFESSHNVREQNNLESKLEIQLKSEEGIHLRTSDGGTISVHQLPENISLSGLKRKQDDVVQASSALLSLQKSGTSKMMDDHCPYKKSIIKKQSRESRDKSCSFTFISWLASVVERMNQTMHYGCSGKPDPLVFHLPKIFFLRLFDRIHKCLRLKKGKMSEETQNFQRKEAVPLGEFTKYTWRLTSLAQVQAVFANGNRSLEVTKFFTQEPDGSYKVCCRSTTDPQLSVEFIRPREYKTILRVGVSPNPLVVLPKETLTPFIIEWIPDILPQTQIGELRIRFEYDHFCNGQFVPPKPFILSPANTPTKMFLKNGHPPIAPRPPLNHKFSFSVPSNNENMISFPINTEHISTPESITLLTF